MVTPKNKIGVEYKETYVYYIPITYSRDGRVRVTHLSRAFSPDHRISHAIHPAPANAPRRAPGRGRDWVRKRGETTEGRGPATRSFSHANGRDPVVTRIAGIVFFSHTFYRQGDDSRKKAYCSGLAACSGRCAPPCPLPTVGHFERRAR